MTTSNNGASAPSEIEANIAAILDPLQELRASLEMELLDLARQTGERQEALGRVDAVIAAASPPKSKGKKGPRDFTAAEKTRGREILGLMEAQPDKDDWTARELAETLEVTTGVIHPALNWLRDEGLVRRARGIQGGGHAYAAYKQPQPA